MSEDVLDESVPDAQGSTSTTPPPSSESVEIPNLVTLKVEDGDDSKDPAKKCDTGKTELGNINVFPPPSSVNPLEPVPNFLQVVEGIDKLRRAIGKELVSGNSNERCSNLPHLLSIAQLLLKPTFTTTSSTTLLLLSTPSAVLKRFVYVPKKTKKTVRYTIDIVSADRDAWFKVSARNPRSLALLAAGGGGYGQKSMLDHAKEYIQCAKQNPIFFKSPQITFVFTSGIGMGLCGKLEALGVKVVGEKIPDAELPLHPRLKPYKELLSESDSNNQSGEDSVDGKESGEMSSSGSTTNGHESKETHVKSVLPKSISKSASLIRNRRLEGITKLNLDITALLAYVSNLTNGHINVIFRTKVLTQQLEFEKMRPQKPILDSIFKGRELYCCEMAFKEFKTILETVGGFQEQRRACEFLQRVKVVPDQISERSKTLQVIGNIKLRSVTIFGTGDSIQAVTVTANTGFVRSAQAQGIEYPVFLHESRALTEEKENFNSLIDY